MVSALDPRSNGLGSSPGQGHCVLCSWVRYFTLIVPLSSQGEVGNLLVT